MLSVRLASALVLIPAVAALVWWLPSWGVAAVVALIMLVAAWEWSQFIPATGGGRLAFLGLTAVCLMLTAPHDVAQSWVYPVISCAMFWWFCAGLWLIRYPAGFSEHRPSRLMRVIIGLLILVPASAAIWAVHQLDQGRLLLLVLLALVWATDTGGYFAGKNLGRHKLAPQISPNKTWEGVAGGLLFAALVALVAALFLFEPNTVDVGRFVVLGVLVAAVSIVGDLTISMFKRQCQVKDTGQVIPGHGGILDRLDSLFAAAPALYVGYRIFGP